VIEFKVKIIILLIIYITEAQTLEGAFPDKTWEQDKKPGIT
jgi:hypothetical protein